MNVLYLGGGIVALTLGAFFMFGDGFGTSNLSEGYERGAYYEKCDTDYLQSARHLGFRASESECECFDDKLQKLSPAQQRAAYATLEDKLTLAFMGKAGATVRGSNVSFNDDALGAVSADLNVETSGKAIIHQCSMF